MSKSANDINHLKKVGGGITKKIKIEFDQEELKQLLKDFYTVTGVRIVVYDDSFQKLGEYPDIHSTYCGILRKDEKARVACKNCDLTGLNTCKKQKKMYIYQCHAGLVEAVVPVMNGDMIIGYLMLGQIILEDNKSQLEKWDELYQCVNKYQVDFAELRDSYEKKERLSQQKLYAAAKIMETCASHLYLTRIMAVSEKDLLERIEEYINENIKERLSPDDICEEFGIHRTNLYELFNHGFGEGIAQHVRRIRIRRAEELLKKTELKISDISEAIGFSDYNYFTKIFKKVTGKTPRDYRKESVESKEIQE